MRAFAITGMVTADMISRMMRHGGHAGDAAFFADVGGHAFERHHGAGAGVFRDHGLLGVDDVHNDAALEHFGQTDFKRNCSSFRIICFLQLFRNFRPSRGAAYACSGSCAATGVCDHAAQNLDAAANLFRFQPDKAQPQSIVEGARHREISARADSPPRLAARAVRSATGIEPVRQIDPKVHAARWHSQRAAGQMFPRGLLHCLQLLTPGCDRSARGGASSSPLSAKLQQKCL